MRKVGIGDFAVIRKLSDLTLSPSGQRAAWTVSTGDLEANATRTDIWVYRPDAAQPLYRLTAMESGRAPVFEDEDHILFPGDRLGRHPDADGRTWTVWNRISLLGGEAEEAFALPFKASRLTPLPGGRYLVAGVCRLDRPDLDSLEGDARREALAAIEEEKDYEVFDELPFWFNGRGVINKQRGALFLIGPDGSREKLTERLFDLHGYAVSADGARVVYWGDSFETVDPQKSRLFIRDLSGGGTAEAPLDGRYTVATAAFCGDRVVFAASTGERYGTSENPAFYLCDPADGSFRLLADPDASLGAAGSDIAGGGDSVQGDAEGIRFVRTVGYRSVYQRLRLDGGIETLADSVPVISCARGADPVFFLGMEKDRPQELYRLADGRCERLSAFNEAYVREHATAVTEHFTFTDRDGVEIDGWILRPADFDPARRWPAILDVHGGPQTAYGEGFFHEMQYWAAHGYVVFFCNPRGSSGRGGAFADIYGEQYGVRDYNDLMDFTDAVLARVPQIDPSRVAMTGGSYGGFMANWIVGHTDRFAAVASQRSISNYISKCLTTDIGYYHNLSAIQADPWSSPERMWRRSPLAYADRAKTPTLFIQSDEDYRCWMGDAVQMLQALLMHGVPARMCLFHGENHELSRSGKPKHRVRRLREITRWFDRYLHVDPEDPGREKT